MNPMSDRTSMAYQISIPVLRREELQEKVFKLTLSSSLICNKAKPGNFVHVRVSQIDSPLLRRPFSIHKLKRSKNCFEILFKVIGPGTEILSKVLPGESLDVLGPIGNNFTLPKKQQEIMLVAGGMGIAPLWFLLHGLMGRVGKGKLTFFLGCKNKEELLYVESLKSLGINLVIATDDGSAGRKGQITEVFLKEMKKRGKDLKNVASYSCGPQMMLKRMSYIAGRLDLFCQVSLETHMACGMGACWGCVVKLKDGNYRRVCVDGPVFDAREMDWA
jgi:dihydroorotate dehydrogenase electron transfer subunit